MRLDSYLRKLDPLASADTLQTPIAGFCRPIDRVEDVPDKQLPIEDKGYERVSIVIEGQRPIAYLPYAQKLLWVLEENAATTTISEGMLPIAPEMIIDPIECFTEILGRFERTRSKILFVGDADALSGSISIAELLKPPALVYLLCMSLELEGAANELCSRFPNLFSSLESKRQESARDNLRKRKPKRTKARAEFEREWEYDPCEELPAEWIQMTMMCDKRDMLAKSVDLGLRTPSKEIHKTFELMEKLRNYVVHPSAQFTWDQDAAIQLHSENHERIEDEVTCSIPIAVSIDEELGLNAVMLATVVRECRELITDIDRAQLRTV